LRTRTSEFRYRRWVSPFGNPRIKASSQLPAAYRSVVRPSSPLSAKAFTKCPYDTWSLSLSMPTHTRRVIRRQFAPTTALMRRSVRPGTD